MNGTDLDLQVLRAFVATVEHEGVSAAARALGLAKSRVSRALAEVEAAAGTRLVQRSTRRFRPTAPGLALARRFRTALGEVEAGLGEASQSTRVIAGPLVVTAPPLLVTLLERELLSSFLSRHSQVSLELRCTNRVVELISEGIDVAFRVGGALPDSSLTGRRLGEVGSSLVASPEYLARRGPPRSVEALREHDCLVFSSMGRTAVWPLRGRPVSVRGRLAADDFGVLLGLVRGGQGISALPDFVVQPLVERGELCRVLHAERFNGPTVWVVWPPQRHPSAVTRAFIDHAAQVVPQLLGEARRGPRSPSGRATRRSPKG